MNDTCARYEGLRARWADGEVGSPELLDLRRHLDACPACADDVRRQQDARQALRGHAAQLRGAAPDALRQRVEALVAAEAGRGKVLPMAAHRARRAWARPLTWMPRSVAAALLLAVSGIVAAGALAPTGGVLAAQLALDHLKCLVIAPTEPGVDARRIERQWEQSHGWAVTLPESSPERGIALVGLRTCLYHDGRMAHVLYDRGGHRVSLFVMPHREAAAAVLDVFGQQTRTWTRDGRTYALVASGAGSLDEVADYFEAHAR